MGIPKGMSVTLWSENGMLGVGPFPYEGEEDADLVNAAKQTITELDPSSYFSPADGFARSAAATSRCRSWGHAGARKWRPSQLDGAPQDGQGQGRRHGPGGRRQARGGGLGPLREGPRASCSRPAPRR